MGRGILGRMRDQKKLDAFIKSDAGKKISETTGLTDAQLSGFGSLSDLKEGVSAFSAVQKMQTDTITQGSSIEKTVAENEQEAAAAKAKITNMANNNAILMKGFDSLTPAQKATAKFSTDESGKLSLSTGITQDELDLRRESAVRETAEKAAATTAIDIEGKKQVASDIAFNNIAKTTGASRELVTTYAGSLEEGGMGSLVNSIKSSFAEMVGGDQSVLYDDTLAFEGLKTEILAAMMPLLTQQGAKEGSVRLVATVFDRLAKTLPNKRVDGFVGRNMMRTTIRNMARRARAAEMLGLTAEQLEGMTDEQAISQFSGKISAMASNIVLSPAEDAALKKMMRAVMEPLDQVLANSVDGVLIYDNNNNGAIVTRGSYNQYLGSGESGDLDVINDLSVRQGLTPKESRRIIKRRKRVKKRREKNLAANSLGRP